MMWTDDPIADAERYAARQEELLEKLPKCIHCKQPIQNGYCYEINGELVCESCRDIFYKKEIEED